MCNEYALEQNLRALAEAFAELLPFQWENGLQPNDLAPRARIRIRDVAPMVRFREERLEGSTRPWAWLGHNGKPVFNFRSEGRDFGRTDRVLIPATGFYVYTNPKAAKMPLKDRHLCVAPEVPWFWMAGIVQDAAFSLLTTNSGPTLGQYHSRTVIALRPQEGLEWLRNAQLRSAAAALTDCFEIRTLRRDGVELAAGTQEPPSSGDRQQQTRREPLDP